MNILFDSGPIIAMTMNHMAEVLPKLKERFNGEFLITPSVKRELVDTPLKIKRFEMEALIVNNLLERGVLKVIGVDRKKVDKLLSIANSSFKIKGRNMSIIHDAEVETLVAVQKECCLAVIDERTIRLLKEDPHSLKSLLERRFHTGVEIVEKRSHKFQELTKELNIIRSSELISVAYKLGLLDNYAPKAKNGKRILLDAILYGLKSEGCAITEEEIEDTKRYLL